jgi:hypothetical protein
VLKLLNQAGDTLLRVGAHGVILADGALSIQFNMYPMFLIYSPLVQPQDLVGKNGFHSKHSRFTLLIRKNLHEVYYQVVIPGM